MALIPGPVPGTQLKVNVLGLLQRNLVLLQRNLVLLQRDLAEGSLLAPGLVPWPPGFIMCWPGLLAVCASLVSRCRDVGTR